MEGCRMTRNRNKEIEKKDRDNSSPILYTHYFYKHLTVQRIIYLFIIAQYTVTFFRVFLIE